MDLGKGSVHTCLGTGVRRDFLECFDEAWVEKVSFIIILGNSIPSRGNSKGKGFEL